MKEFEDDKFKLENQQSGPASDVAFGVVFFLGGAYMILAFSSFWIFLIGFVCVILGAAMALGGLSESRIGDSLHASGKPIKHLSNPDKENELLRALQSKEGGASPTEAALETSLSVREADDVLSELASRGYLAVESHEGALFYSIPKRPASP